MLEQLDTVSRVYVMVTEFLVTYSFQLMGAVLITVAGFLVAGGAGRFVLRLLRQRAVDVALAQLLAMTVRIAVLGLFAVIAMAKLGISIAPLIAAVGGAAVGIGLALQGTLSNYGSGLSIILSGMYRVGDNIEVLGYSGVVEDISLGATTLRTEDGEDIIIPNRKVGGEVHRNSYRNRIVESTLGVTYAADPEQAVSLIESAIRSVSGVVPEHEPHVGIERFGESTIAIGYRYWVPNTMFFETRHAVNVAIHRALRGAGISLCPRQELLLANRAEA